MPLQPPAPQPHGLDPARYAVVDDELRRAEAYFARLRDEIRAAAADTNKTGYSVRRAELAVEAVQQLRTALALEQEHRKR